MVIKGPGRMYLTKPIHPCFFKSIVCLVLSLFVFLFAPRPSHQLNIGLFSPSRRGNPSDTICRVPILLCIISITI
ncbi:hypothetical protein V8C44DRAFT_335724 [Trichoderma aethiopicum]